MRAADEKRCGSGTLAQQEAEKAARNSHHSNAIDLTGDFDFSDDLIILDDTPSGSNGPHSSHPTGSQPPSQPGQPTGSRPGASQPHAPRANVLTKPRPPPIKKASKPPTGSPWACSTCTLINQPLALQCDACLAARPSQTRIQTTDTVPTGWTCTVCGEQGMDHNFWTCRFCGSVKAESSSG
jgi:DNA-dependent metalloprotease WSS1